jgi:hypothetical protein
MFHYLALQLYVLGIPYRDLGLETGDFSHFMQENSQIQAASTSIFNLEIAELGIEQISLICWYVDQEVYVHAHYVHFKIS